MLRQLKSLKGFIIWKTHFWWDRKWYIVHKNFYLFSPVQMRIVSLKLIRTWEIILLSKNCRHKQQYQAENITKLTNFVLKITKSFSSRHFWLTFDTSWCSVDLTSTHWELDLIMTNFYLNLVLLPLQCNPHMYVFTCSGMSQKQTFTIASIRTLILHIKKAVSWWWLY